MCQRGVPSKGLWGRGDGGGLRYTPLEPNMQEVGTEILSLLYTKPSSSDRVLSVPHTRTILS